MKYINKIMVTLSAVASLFAVSCNEKPGEYNMTDGVPTIHYVRPVDVASADSLLSGAYMDNMICVVGENLKSVYQLYFNDQKAILNNSYITDNTLLVTVPGTIPELVTDKMYFITAAQDTVKYDFSVIIPGPKVSSMSCEYVPVGEVATIYGDYFIDDPNVPFSITFPDDVPVTEIVSLTKNAVSFKVPEGAVEGKIDVKTIYGTVSSPFHYMDTRGLMFEFDGVTNLTNHGWHPRVIANEGGLTGNYVQLGDGATALNDSSWGDGQFAFEYWCGDWNTPQNITSGEGIALYNLVDFTDFKNMSLKFEMFIPSSNPWSAAAMQICFEGVDKVTLSGNPIDGEANVAGANAYAFNNEQNNLGSWGRAMYRPWTSTGSFHTDDQWITVTVPFSEFKYDKDGNPTDFVPQSAKDFGSLTIFMIGGGVAGTECAPIVRLDNIRAVSNR